MLTTNVFRRSVTRLESAAFAVLPLAACYLLASDCLTASYRLTHSLFPLHWTSRHVLLTQRPHSCCVCAYNLPMRHLHCSDVSSRDTALRFMYTRISSACWVSSLVVMYRIHSEVWTVVTGRRTFLAHGWCGWWKSRWRWTSWNRVKGWAARFFLNATP